MTEGSSNDALTDGERFQIAARLSDASVAIMRQNLRREHPGLSEAEIDQRLVQWMHTRPGAEHGDGQGRPRPLTSLGL